MTHAEIAANARKPYADAINKLQASHDTLTAQRDALAEALRFCVKALEVEAPIYKAHIDEARAALALVDGAR